MSRATEWRSKPLPKDWARTRRRILRRDRGICHVCGQPGANQVDHVIPTSAGGSDDDDNLAAIHQYPCHAHKTATEAQANNWKAQPRKRPEEQHPGVIQRSAAIHSPSGASSDGAPRKRRPVTVRYRPEP